MRALFWPVLPRVLCLSLASLSVSGCTETSKAWVRPDTPPETVDQQKHLCKVWSEGQVGWRTGLSDEEKAELKGRTDMFFRECMTLNKFREEETTTYK